MNFLEQINQTKVLVPPSGDLKSDICFVGEAPGKDEVAGGAPFIGMSGNLLRRLMMAAGIPPGLTYMTNVIKERPKNNDIKPFFNGKTFTESAQSYLASLKEEIEQFSGNVICAVGGVALAALTGEVQISKYRGSILPCTLVPGKKVVATTHPSAALRQYILRYLILQDLRKVLAQSKFPEIKYPDRSLIIQPQFHETIAWLDAFHASGIKEMCLDIECTGQLQLACIAFSYNGYEALCIPITIYTASQEAEIALQMAKIISDPTITLIGQNIAFDLMFLLKRYNIIPYGRIEDTMIAQGVLFHDLPKGLDTLCSIYTDEPYYKDEGKEWKKVRDWKRFWTYNAKDAVTTMEIWNTLSKMLDDQGFRKTYELDMRKHHPLFFAMTRGMAADPSGIEQTKEDLITQITDTQEALDDIVLTKFPDMKEVKVDPNGDLGYLNVGSAKQMKEYFYDRLRISPYVKSGKPTVDDKALARLAKGTASRPPLKEARLAQELRKLKKFRGTYLEMDFDNDNRFRCTYSPRGTYTGRLSSSKTIFHTGMNMQNLPPAFKHFLHADPGHILLEFDGVQAEWVATAYISGDIEMIGVIESGRDPHTATASFITGLSPEFIVYEDSKIGHTTDPEEVDSIRKQICEENSAFIDEYRKAIFIPRTMSARQAGKKSNHGFNYGMHPGKFALINEIPEADANMAHKVYHSTYPGLSNWYASIQDKLSKDRILENPFGRKARFLDRWGPDLFMQAYAFLPQSTSADRIIDAMLTAHEMEQSGHRHSSFLRHGQLLGQIHDSILYQFNLDAGQEALIRFCYLIRELIEKPITYQGRTFCIRAECTAGVNWGQMKKVPFGNKFEQEIKLLSGGHDEN